MVTSVEVLSEHHSNKLKREEYIISFLHWYCSISICILRLLYLPITSCQVAAFVLRNTWGYHVMLLLLFILEKCSLRVRDIQIQNTDDVIEILLECGIVKDALTDTIDRHVKGHSYTMLSNIIYYHTHTNGWNFHVLTDCDCFSDVYNH